MGVSTNVTLERDLALLHFEATANKGAEATGTFNPDTFEQLGDALYEAAMALNDHPNSYSAATYMKAVTNLSAYLKANPPTGTDPVSQLAKQINGEFLNGSFYDSKTGQSYDLTTACGTINPTSIALIERNSQNNLMTGLYSDLDNVDNYYVDNNSKNYPLLRDDLQHLQGLLDQYQNDSNMSPPNPVAINADLVSIASWMSTLQSQVKTLFPNGLHDGFLTVLETSFNAGAFGSGSTGTSLLALCQAVNKDPTSTTALSSLNSALQEMGENSSNGGALSEMLAKTLNEES